MPHRAWNKGLTKKTSAALARIAHARREKNNFAGWQKKHPVYYAQIPHNGDFAELYGTLLGDGCIEKFPRTEKLDISFNAKEVAHIEHIKKIIIQLFKKEPSTIRKINCIHLTLYQRDLSERLAFPSGEKKKHDLRIPGWVTADKKLLIRCLKGLFESDGSWVIDPRYNTNCMDYTSIHQNLLRDIQRALRSLGFFANLTKRRVILSRRAETAAFAKLIKFRQY
jgi:intein/homing endonuclease